MMEQFVFVLSIRTLIAMGVAEGWSFDQMDASTTFLYEVLEETCVEVPEGMTSVDTNGYPNL